MKGFHSLHSWRQSSAPFLWSEIVWRYDNAWVFGLGESEEACTSVTLRCSWRVPLSQCLQPSLLGRGGPSQHAVSKRNRLRKRTLYSPLKVCIRGWPKRWLALLTAGGMHTSMAVQGQHSLHLGHDGQIGGSTPSVDM